MLARKTTILLCGDGILSTGEKLKVVAAFESLVIWARKGQHRMFVGPDKRLCPGTSPLSHPVQAGVLTFPEPLLVCISAMSLPFFTEREKIIIIIWVLSKLFSCT